MNGQTSASIMAQNSRRGMLIYSRMSFGLSRDTHCSITGLAAANSATKTVLSAAGSSQSARPRVNADMLKTWSASRKNLKGPNRTKLRSARARSASPVVSGLVASSSAIASDATRIRKDSMLSSSTAGTRPATRIGRADHGAPQIQGRMIEEHRHAGHRDRKERQRQPDPLAVEQPVGERGQHQREADLGRDRGMPDRLDFRCYRRSQARHVQMTFRDGWHHEV